MKWGEVWEEARHRGVQAWWWATDRPSVGTLGDIEDARLGVHPGQSHPYLPRRVDDGLEDRIGSSAPLVVVVGESLAGTSRATVRAARRMLGAKQRLLVPSDLHTADLRRLIASASHRDTVIWLDGAPLELLDQITPASLRLARRSRVRLVVTTRPGLVVADHPDPETERLLRDASGPAVGPLTEDEARGSELRAGRRVGREVLPHLAADALIDPVGWSSLVPLAITRIAASWEQLGVPLPLTPDRVVLLAGSAQKQLDVATPAPADDVREVLRDRLARPYAGLQVLTRERRRGRPHVRCHPLLRESAVPNRSLADLLLRELDPEQLGLVARNALAAGEVAVAAYLLRHVPACRLSPRRALLVAEERAADPESERWYRLALEGEGAVRTRAQLGLSTLLEQRRSSPLEVRALLEAAVPDQRALLRLGQKDTLWGRDKARPWFLRAAAGPDPDLAAEAAWKAAELDLTGTPDRQTLTLLRQAIARSGAWTLAATFALGRTSRVLGDGDSAEQVLGALSAQVDRVEHAEVWLEWGQVAEDRGDLVEAARRYENAVHLWDDDGEEATLRLAGLDLQCGRFTDARDRVERWRGSGLHGGTAALPRLSLPRVSSQEPRASSEEPRRLRFAAGRLPRASWVAGEAAYQLRDWATARVRLAGATELPGESGETATLHLARIEFSDRDLLAADDRLVGLAAGSGSRAEEARNLRAAYADQVARLREKEERRRAERERLAEEGRRGRDKAYVAVMRDGRHRIVYGP